MAAITNHSNINAQLATDHSPRSPNQSHRATRAASPPWAKIICGESEPIAAVSSSLNERPAAATTSALEEESMENGSSANGNAGKRQAWNKPSNGAVDVEPVMGAHSWPPLSESGKVSSRSSCDSLKGSTDGSQSSSLPASQKQVGDNSSHPNSTPNHTLTTRERSTKRNGATTSINGPAAHSAPVEASTNNRDTSSRDHVQRSGFQGYSDHTQQRNSFRNRSGGSHRGDNSHHPNYGGRHNQDWSGLRNFNGRDTHLQTQRIIPGFIRHPQRQPTRPPPPPPPPIPPMSIPPFIAARLMRPFGAHIAYPDMGPVFYFTYPTMESLRAMSPVVPMSPIYPQPPELQLHARIVSQIDYYFSNENLIKDVFLRQNMDDQGWVAINLIAGFKKVSELTDNVQLILDALRNSTVVEVQGEKVRKRNDWIRWIMPPSVKIPTVSSPRSQELSCPDVLAKGLQNASLGRKTSNENSVAIISSRRLSSDEGNEAVSGI